MLLIFPAYPKVMTVIVAFASAAIISIFVQRYFSKYVQKYVLKNKAGYEAVYKLVQKLVIIGIFGVATYISALSAFPQLGAYLASTLIAAGFLSVVVGLAAQKTLENLFAGFSIAFSKPFRLGDAVVIRNEYGTVEDITLRQTVLKTWDNRRLVIPNSVLDEEIIINYSLNDEKKLFNITLNVPYDTDIDKVSRIMVDEARKHKGVSKELKPIFQLLDFAESAMTLRLLFISKDQPTAFNAGVDIRRAIKRRFDKEGIRFSVPTRYIVGSKQH